MTRETPRRDFLLGRIAGEVPITVPQAQSIAAVDPYLLRLSRRAMACEFEICLPAAIAGEATAVALEALDLVQSLERQLSYFLPDSEISAINRTAANGPVEVEPRLFVLLQQAMQLWHETNGAYDITAAPLWVAWGFARRAGTIPSPEQLAEAMSRVGGQYIELDAANRTIGFHRKEIELNLGSIGKGYAVDRCVEHLQAAGVADFLVHGGFSSVAARGFADAADAAWTVGIKDPLNDEHRLGQLELHDRALGTSGTQFQSFRYQGKRYGHILDPRTGWPADASLAATVLAPTAALADALSTAFYVLGPDALTSALPYFKEEPVADATSSRHSTCAGAECNPEIAAILFSPRSQACGYETHSIGFELPDLFA